MMKKQMRRAVGWLCAALLFATQVSCAQPRLEGEGAIPHLRTEGARITDSLGNTFPVSRDARVISLYGSYAEAWVLAGGTLAGATRDAVEERGMAVEEDAIVGSVKSPNLEAILALEPDYVILSADVTPQRELESSLREMDVPYGYFQVDTFEDYRNMMHQFCAVTGRDDLYRRNVEQAETRIEGILSSVPQGKGPAVLLIRAFSTGAKAKTEDNLAGIILKELGCDNIASRHPSLLEELSLEEVIREDPQYIFILTMGDEEEALAFLEENFESNPAWSGLSAVEEGRCYVLPKALFHNKPNERWGESYAYLAEILYPQA